MSGHGDKAMGKVKEVAGRMTGDEDLEAKGKGQHTTGKVKEAVSDATDEVVDKTRGAVDAVKDKLPGHK